MLIKIDGKKYDYQPYKDALYKEKMILRIRNNKSYINVLKRDVTDKFISIIQNIVNPKFHFTENILLSMSGLSGSGKSTCIISMGLQLFPAFSEKNIFFFDNQVLENAHKFPKNTLLIRDENPSKAVFGQGSTRTSGQLVVLSETCRAQGLNLAFIEPQFAPDPVIKFYLSTCDFDVRQRITRCGLMESESHQFIGAVYIHVIPEEHPILINYNQRKNEFIDKMKKGDFSGSKLDYKGIARECMEDEDFEMYRNKTERKAYLVTKFPNYTSGEIETILAMINVINREGDSGL